MTVKRWICAACRPEVTRRSIRVAIIVGTLLVAVNYSDRWLEGNLNGTDYLKMLLTYLVPYVVSTYVSVSTLLTSDKA